MHSAPDTVTIVDYDQLWPAEFQEISTSIRYALGNFATRIDHIGSTAIVGMGAKPIIDIQVSVPNLEPMVAYLATLQSLGYDWHENHPEKTRRHFHAAKGRRNTHIHVRKAGSWHEQFALLFRDYLRRHEHEQRHYEQSKRDLAREYHHLADEYAQAKKSICWDIIQRADKWAVETGWSAGESDA